MDITTRKGWRRQLDRTARFLLAAAMVLQISAGSMVAYAADTDTSGETRTDTTQGTPPEFSNPLGSESGDFTRDDTLSGPTDNDPANEPPADGGLTDDDPANDPPADGGLTDDDPANEPPADGALTDDDPANELPADGGLTDDGPANDPPAGGGLTDDDPANEPPAGGGLTDDDPANDPPAGGGLTDDDPANEPPADGGLTGSDPANELLVTDPENLEDEPEEPVTGPTRAPQVRADENNLLAGTGVKFSQGQGTIEGGTATTVISAAGADWTTMLNCPAVFEADYEYKVLATLTTTAARTITIAVIDHEPRDFTSETISANTPATVEFTYKNAEAGTKDICIYLGIQNDFPGEHTVTITNVSLIKQPKEGEDTADGIPIDDPAGNLLKNGSFANKGADWTGNNAGADVYFNTGRTVFYIKQNGADWQQGLKQAVALDENAIYKVTIHINSEVARTIGSNLLDESTGVAFTKMIGVGDNVVTFDAKKAIRDDGDFYLYLGLPANDGLQYPHKVVITGVSIVPKPLDDTQNDQPYSEITSIKGVSPSDAFALPSGNWLTHTEDDAQASFDQSADGKMTVNIANSGNGLDDIRFGKYIDLKAGLEYTLSFDVVSNKERSFNVSIGSITDSSNASGYVRPIAVQANAPRHVVLQVPKQDVDHTGVLFRFYLGKYAGEPSNNATSITFSNIKLEVNGYREKAELIDDGDFTNGLGNFRAQAAGGTTITVRNRSVVAKIAGGLAPVSTFAMSRAGGSTLTRSISGLEIGAQYEVSFVAGAVKPCTLSVAMPDGQTREYRLTSEAKPFSYSFTANQATGDLVFDFGTEQNTICLDTVRLDVQGYTKAAGIDTAVNDISELTSQEPPVISEMALATFGKTVVMQFPHINGEYRRSITGITLDGKPLTPGTGSGGNVASGDYYISDAADSGSWYYIYLNSALFTAPADGSDRRTYEIVVHADYYADNMAHQIVYKPGVFEKLTLNDNFMDKLNTAIWGYQEGNGTDYGLWGWGNNEQQWYTRDNVAVEDGVLKITATPGLNEGSPYNSGRIWTKVNGEGNVGFAQAYGRFEAKIKLPAGEGYQGLWPAFWLLPVEGADYYGGWPVSGEIDIMEARGREPYTMDGTLHFGSPGNDSPIGDHYRWTDQSSSITEYHIYSVDWTPTYISFQVDGHEYVRYESWWSRADGEPQDYAYPAPFDRPFYIILNMAVGGEYDGYRNPDMKKLPADMLVDYVRVYQYANLNLDEIVKAPEIAKETIPAGAKTSIADPAFNTVHKAILDGGYNRNDKNGWYLLTLDSFGGQANSSKTVNDGATFLKVDVTDAGSAAHAVQLIQHLELYQGNWYKLSFDAYADQGRSITAKVAADGTDGNWSSYNEAAAALGTTPQHYEYTFQMRSPTNLHSRLEVNMGGAAGPVYIGGVTFQALDGPSFKNDVTKTPLENGEGIYNGRFNLGTVDRLNYWNASGGTVVKEMVGDNAYEYRFKAGSSSATLTQKGIQLLPTDSYQLKADITGGPVTYAFKDAAGKDILTGTLSGNQTITVPAGTRYDDAQVVFTLPSGAALDNISLVRTTFNNVDYQGKDAYPLFNGDFEAGKDPWVAWVSAFNVGMEDSKVAVLPAAWGPSIYDVGLRQDNVHLYGGHTYELSFRAKTNSGSKSITVRLNGEEHNCDVGSSWNTYSFNVKASSDVDTQLMFFFGNIGTALYLDDVEIRMLGAPEKPGTLTPSGYNRLGEDVAVSLSGGAAWGQSLVPVLNGRELTSGYRVENGRLVLDKSLFKETGEYTLSAKAAGYADSRQAAIRVYPGNGDLIFNGSVENGGVGWEQYASGDRNSVAYADSQVTAHYAELSVDNGSYVPWGIQWNQKITVPADGGYTLRFTAASDVDRYIMVGLKDGAKQMVKLEKGSQECTVPLSLSEGAAELQFWMGAVNPSRENGYFTSADIPFMPSVYSAPHDVSLSNVSLLPQNAKYTSITLTGSTKVALGESATITAELTTESGQPISGTVKFYLNDRQLAASGNKLTLTKDILASAGTYTIRAVYDGGGSYASAQKTIAVTVMADGQTGGLTVESVKTDKDAFAKVRVSGMRADRCYLVRYGASTTSATGVMIWFYDGSDSKVKDGTIELYLGGYTGMTVHVFEFASEADTHFVAGEKVNYTRLVSCPVKRITTGQ